MMPLGLEPTALWILCSKYWFVILKLMTLFDVYKLAAPCGFTQCTAGTVIFPG